MFAACVLSKRGRPGRAARRRLRSRQFSLQDGAGPIAGQELCPRERKQRQAWLGSKTNGGAWRAWKRERGQGASPKSPHLSSGFGLPTDLLFDLPVGEQIFMAATRAFPGSLLRIGSPLVKHLDNEMAMKTHGRVAENQFPFCRFRHNCHNLPPVKLRALPSPRRSPVRKVLPYNCWQK